MDFKSIRHQFFCNFLAWLLTDCETYSLTTSTPSTPSNGQTTPPLPVPGQPAVIN